MAADDWKHRTATGPRPGRPAAKGKGVSRVAIAVFPLLVAAGVAVGLMTWVQGEPAPFLLSIPVAEYEQWPSNPWAQKDADGLKAALPDPENGFIPTQSQSQEGGLEREIEKLEERARSDRGQPVVIHLNALAVADGDAVFVLLSKAAVARRDLWVPLDSVLKAVAKIGGNRLLVLDLRPVPEPRVGQMGNELAKALHKTLAAQEQAQQLPFLVAAYSAPAEYPYVSPELGRGVFAEFLRLGLEGRADGFTGAVDTDVQAIELVTFARAWVVHWLRKHKVPIVAPVLYGTGKDFVVRRVPQNLRPWPEATAAAAPPDELVKAWQTVDEWRAAGAVHKYPRTFRQLQELVVRIDQAAAGDGRWEALALNLRDRMKPLLDRRTALEPQPYPLATVGRLERLAKLKALEPPPPKAEPKADPKGEAKGPDFATEFQKLRDALKKAHLAAGTKEKPVDKKDSDEAKMGLDKAIGAFVAMPPEPPPYDRTVLELFRDLMGSDGTERKRELLEQYGKLFRDLPDPPPHLELAYLALVADPSPEDRDQWPAELPRFLLTAAVRGEEAVAVSSRGLLRMAAKQENEPSLLDPEVKFADTLRGVFASPPSLARWRAAAKAFGEVEIAYQNFAGLGAAHAAAVWEWEEDVALLAAIGDYAPAMKSAGDDSFEKRWKKLRDTTDGLRKAIDQQHGMNELTIAADEARQARLEVEKGLRQTTAGDPVEARARLRLSLWKSDDRQKWTTEANDAALALAKDALADQAAATPAGDVRKPVADDAFDLAAARRAARARALLSLVEPNAPADGTAGWRAALADRLVARFKEAASKPALERATEQEKFAWLIHPADLSAVPVAGGPPAEPTADLRVAADRAAAAWLLENRYNRVVRELEKLPGKPAAAGRLIAALNKAVLPLSTWPR
jgi:hypothetical protein